jgi:hypothetical protein
MQQMPSTFRINVAGKQLLPFSSQLLQPSGIFRPELRLEFPP